MKAKPPRCCPSPEVVSKLCPPGVPGPLRALQPSRAVLGIDAITSGRWYPELRSRPESSSSPSRRGCWEGGDRIPPLLPPRAEHGLVAFICPGDKQTAPRQPSNSFPLWKRDLHAHPLPRMSNIDWAYGK